MVTKKAKVIMLPSELRTDIVLVTLGKVTELRYLPSLNIGGLDVTNYKEFEYQYLYITTDEEIKEGDWVYDCLDGSIRFIEEYEQIVTTDKKIVAATDKSLKLKQCYGCSKELKGGYSCNCKLLPQIPQPFIEEYCEKGGIDEVLVEYEERQQFESEEDYNYNSHIKIKINRDGTINILPIKNSWNREEVTRLCRLAFGQGVRVGLENSESMAFQDLENKWIKENLK